MPARHQLQRISAMIAITAALAACGGGGGDDAPSGDAAPAGPAALGPAAPAPAAAAPTPAASAPTTAPAAPAAPAPAGPTPVQASTQAVANGDYSITAPGAGPVTITLPATASLAAGDTVRVTGTSAAAWQIAQNAGQSVLTAGVTGNAAPGANWTASTMPPRSWHWVASNATGEVLVAANNPGALHISADGGTTWTAAGGLPAAANWIGVDMTPDGQRMVAVAFTGNMYLSNDRGVTWTQVTSAAVNLAARAYEAVTISDDGQRIAAVILNGPIVQSTDGGATWTSSAAALVKPWRAIDSSADGATLIAVSQATQATPGTPAANGEVYLSTNAGATWTPVAVGTGTNGWYRAAVSRNGNVIAIATNSVYAGGGGGLFVSRDRGATWSAAGTAGADYTGIALSEDGTVIGTTISNGTTGNVQYSANAGVSFAPLTVPSGTDTNFRHIAMDRLGYKLAVVTGTFTGTPGQLYTSIGNRTSTGTAGGIAGGGQGESLQLRHEGNGVFRVVSATGGFTVR